MARVLFINGGSEGHINPTLGVVQELIRRGEEVVYVIAEQFRDRIEPTGAEVITFNDGKFLEAFLAGGRNPWARVGGLLRTADIIIPSVLEQIKGEQFDYIIHDSMFGCGRLLAQILDLPAINSCTSFAIQENSFDSLQDRLSRHLPADVNEREQQEFQQLVDNIHAKYNVQVSSAYEVFCNPAPLTIVYTSKCFQPDGESFDETFKFVGPSFVPCSYDQFDFSHLDSDRVIYISLGTVFNQAMDFYKLCFAAFSETRYTVILSVGRQIEIAELGDIPTNFIVRNYVAQIEVLQHSKLFITHGGMNSTGEGLYYGVPLIVLPQSADQPAVARRVAEMGAGIHLNQEGLTAQDLREAAESVLKDASIRKLSIEIGDSFRAAGGYHQAVEEIFMYKRSLGMTK
ncbi:macrolide family glycosyltransferase [Paenibacillus macquariensis]|uniref:Glycosyltransferase, MGT family n=1 Tax=Paenibacillus macquariensis TaxID=948756 RepID=A0ABY1JMZ4_9BACL|nr:macrolide family glycosyltransferase [Paenibacillus macquariensis]MEC0092257.1 glycosyltransferase [Paenibacillus macquariensis]OAB37198.1 glycosyl transferase family 1 [Paenibacillus macquariensis subsp. macquariensis]SIQ47658.1 glycosyltransferase, MGT family [Paenibacillus macquariensis]